MAQPEHSEAAGRGLEELSMRWPWARLLHYTACQWCRKELEHIEQLVLVGCLPIQVPGRRCRARRCREPRL